MVGEITAEELAIILSACAALIVAILTVVLKFLVDTRSEAKAINRAVNNRPSDEPSIYERVAGIEGTLRRLDLRLERQGDTQTARHFENSGRIREVRDAVTRVEDRVAELEHKGEP